MKGVQTARQVRKRTCETSGNEKNVESNNSINSRSDTIKERIGEVEGRTEEITQWTVEIEYTWDIERHEGWLEII